MQGKNHSPIQSTVIEKSRKTARNWPFLTKNAFFIIFRQFFLKKIGYWLNPKLSLNEGFLKEWQ